MTDASSLTGRLLVAMPGIGGMQEDGRRAGGGERRGHLARDDAALADAGDDDTTADLHQDADKAQEGGGKFPLTKAGFEFVKAGRSNGEASARRLHDTAT